MIESKRTAYGDYFVSSPVLASLENDRIFTIDIEGNPGQLIIREACDGYFSKALSKEELGALIEELKLIYEQMP